MALTDLSMTTPVITMLLDGQLEPSCYETLAKLNEICLTYLNRMMKQEP